MLVKFVLDPDGLNLEYLDRSLRRSLTGDIISVWQNHGVLFLGGEEFRESPLAKAIDRLPQELKTLWQKALVYARKHRLVHIGPVEWRGAFDSGTLTNLSCLRGIDVAGVARDCATELGVPENEYSIQLSDPELEICKIDCFQHARLFEAATRRRNGEYQRGASVATVWGELFAPLIGYFHRITVIDRYCATNFVKRWDRKSGLARLLSEISTLDECSRPKRLVIVSGLQEIPATKVVQEIKQFVDQLNSDVIAELNLMLVPDKSFLQVKHQRYVRFDESRCLVLDPGIEILDGEKLFRTNLYLLTMFSDILRQDESVLLRHSRVYPILKRSDVSGSRERSFRGHRKKELTGARKRAAT